MAEEKLLNRIRGLLAKAERTENEHEREAFYAHAQRLMDQHRIDMALLDLGGKSAVREAIRYMLQLGWSEWTYHKWGILFHIADHCGVVAVREPGDSVALIGMKDDIEMAELLYTLSVMEFDTRINPTWDPEKSFGANVKALQEAGKKWVEIAHIANRHGGNPKTGLPGSTTDGSWLKTAYRRECARVGEEPRRQTQRHEAYRESFADSFKSTIWQRLERMRSSADEERGGSIDRLPAIMSAKDRVNAKLWELYPHLHPDAIAKARAERKAREAARLAAMTPQERLREQREYEKILARPSQRSLHDEAGWKAGHNAAKRVDLLGGQNRVKNQGAIG